MASVFKSWDPPITHDHSTRVHHTDKASNPLRRDVSFGSQSVQTQDAALDEQDMSLYAYPCMTHPRLGSDVWTGTERRVHSADAATGFPLHVTKS